MHTIKKRCSVVTLKVLAITFIVHTRMSYQKYEVLITELVILN
jgi:hypothetical protein